MIERKIAPPSRDPEDLSIPGGMLNKEEMDALVAYANERGLDTPHARLDTAMYIENLWKQKHTEKNADKCVLCGQPLKSNGYGMCQRCYRSLFMQKRIRTVHLVRGYKFYGMICAGCGRRPVLANGMCNPCLQLADHHGFKTAREVYEYRQSTAKKVKSTTAVLKPVKYSFDKLPIPEPPNQNVK